MTKISREMLIIIAIQITEVLGFSLILPFLPLFAQDMGASPLVVGLILTVFSLFQFISAPIMGRLSDVFGRRPLLILSQISTFLSFVVLGFATELWMIFASRIIDGMLGSNFTIAQAYMSDISSKKDRAKVFGYSGMAFGIGFLVGPAIGGFFSQYGYQIPSFIAAAVAFATVVMTYVFLPETVKRKAISFGEIKIIDMSHFKRYFADPQIASRMWQFFFFFMAHMTWVSAFAIFANKQLGFEAREVGYFLAYLGFISVLMRGLFIPRLIDKFGERQLRNSSLILMLVGLLALTRVRTLAALVPVITVYAYSIGVLRPLLMAAISKRVSSKQQGAVMGVTNALASLGQIIAPVLGGYMLSNFSPGSLPLVAAGLMLVTLYINSRERKALLLAR